MTYIEKLEETIRELDSMPQDMIDELVENSMWCDREIDIKDVAFLTGVEEGLRIAMDFAKLFKIDEGVEKNG